MMRPALSALIACAVSTDVALISRPPASQTAATSRNSHAGASRPTVRKPRLMWSVSIKSQSFGSAAVADLDGDGKIDVAFETYFGDSAVHALHGDTGKPQWTWKGKGECLDASARISDETG